MSVPLALLAGGTARRRTGFDHCADDSEIGLRLSDHDAAGGGASIGAVETEANAADQVPNVVLGETRIGAACATGGAVEAVVDAAQERLAIDAGWVWMHSDELVDGHFGSFLFERSYRADAARCRCERLIFSAPATSRRVAQAKHAPEGDEAEDDQRRLDGSERARAGKTGTT
jgi:hypothetical protein